MVCKPLICSGFILTLWSFDFVNVEICDCGRQTIICLASASIVFKVGLRVVR
jgi:hypothetical protein